MIDECQLIKLIYSRRMCVKELKETLEIVGFLSIESNNELQELIKERVRRYIRSIRVFPGCKISIGAFLFALYLHSHIEFQAAI